ncbi:MAG TPA: sugar kinase [Rhizomicrobium sp.]|jgi:2-dehydro-3-deoxygluconokinase|nr:sugar kinase [Rhizomicrobium sp.]
MTTAISIGECMVELRAEPDGRLRRSFAGDAYNTAVYLKRSAPEIEVAFLTATGEESLSAAMIETWRGEGISDRLAFRIPGTRPALYLIETDAKGDRTFHYWRGDSPARQWFRCVAQAGPRIFDGADLVYVSGISLAILNEEDRRNAIAFLGKLPIRIAFDPNIRPALWATLDQARETFEAMGRIAAILLPSRQDLQLLYGIEDAPSLMKRMAEMRAGEIALTSDEAGCILRAGGEIVTLPVTASAAVVDTSGAGDSFNGAYLAARLQGRPPLEAARAGLRLAAKVIGAPGAIIPRE